MKNKKNTTRKKNKIMVIDQGTGAMPDAMACCLVAVVFLR